MTRLAANRSKIARRVIEVLEFFDETHAQVTVMDIVRRFDRPQSSTSELLSSLVELGVLYRDRETRAYLPTPRAAMLGCAVQPEMVRDGRLVDLVERLGTEHDLTVALVSMVGVNAQICRWRPSGRASRSSGLGAIRNGRQDHLCASAAGRLLLSTVPLRRREAIIRRLNAEAAPENKFAVNDMAEAVRACRDTGHASGVFGFGTRAQATAILLPGFAEEQPMALAVAYEGFQQVDPEAMVEMLTEAIAPSRGGLDAGNVHPLFDAGEAVRPRDTPRDWRERPLERAARTASAR